MERLINYFQEKKADKICIAFSGGVDSSLLLKLATIYHKNVCAATFETVLHPSIDLVIAKKMTEEMQVEHHVLHINELDDKEILNNPVDRCYRCKSMLFVKLKEFCAQRGIRYVIDGTNVDDLAEYRPGIRALKEQGIESPLALLGITKKEVRKMAEELEVLVAKRPSAPCLATRLPYNTKIDLELLAKIEKGEDYLKSIGLEVNRIRVHEEIARIEILPVNFPTVIEHRTEIIRKLKEIGFLYITLDLEGFRSGSMDIHLK